MRHLIPIPSLGVDAPWAVGRVTFHPGATGQNLIAENPPPQTEGDVIKDFVHDILELGKQGSIADVPDADSIDSALEQVRESLAALRLFQRSRSLRTETTFGVPGDITSAMVRYLLVGEQAGGGFIRQGQHQGYRFGIEAQKEWSGSEPFHYLHSALCDPSDEGRIRAVRGTLLFDRGATEHRPDLRMIGFTSALEAWLLQRAQNGQTFRLARHVSWFGCGAHDGDLCGRARPICPYLHLRPDDRQDRSRLKDLRALGDDHVAWRCDEWHRAVDWYDARSEVVHGGYNNVETDDANEAEYWISHHLAPSILIWLRDHPKDPIGDLSALLDAQPEPPGWPAMIAALDSTNPPTRPPTI